MSTNKQQLQLNNTDLQSILSTVLGLPTQESVKHGAYVWKKLTAQGGDFVDFVVSDSESAYPDGGTQDGYWYEKVVEGISLPPGFTKFAVDKITLTSRTSASIAVFSHSLNAIPKVAVLVAKQYVTIEYDILYAVGSHRGDSTESNGNSAVVYYGGSGYGNFNSAGTMYSTNTTVQLTSLSRYYPAGIEYTLITMA